MNLELHRTQRGTCPGLLTMVLLLMRIAAPLLAPAACPVSASSAYATVLGIKGSQFTVDNIPTFLTGISYFSGLCAASETVNHDLDAMQEHGFNWLRVWADWSYRDDDMSAVDQTGQPREPYMTRLKQLVAACDQRHMIVDVTLSRGKTAGGGGIPDMPAHLAAVRCIVSSLSHDRNWYMDLANEHDVRDARFVSAGNLRDLRNLARKLAPWLKVTASVGAHDLGEADLREALQESSLDFVAPHRRRDAQSPSETEMQTRLCLALMNRIGHIAPILYQEPFRRGYGGWQPKAEDYAADLLGARAGGAAGWCFHNGSTKQAADSRPRKSFDLRDGPLFDQLDAEERRFLSSGAISKQQVPVSMKSRKRKRFRAV